MRRQMVHLILFEIIFGGRRDFFTLSWIEYWTEASKIWSKSLSGRVKVVAKNVSKANLFSHVRKVRKPLKLSLKRLS